MSLPLLGAGMATDGPSAVLDLNFASLLSLTPSVGPTPSFTRASTGTYFDSSGVLTTAAINGPRFDHVYNGSSWVSNGLLVEEQRTNLVFWSEDQSNANWTKDGGSISANSAVAPNGLTTADLLTENSSNSNHRTYQSMGSITNPTVSLFVKANGRTWINLGLYANNVLYNSYFNLTGAGSIGTTTATSASIANVGNGWYRISACKSGVSIGGYFQPQLATSNGVDTYLGDGTSGMYFWGAQIEAGSFPTSYIPTTTATVTRSADVCQITGGDFSGFWNSSEGSFAVEYEQIKPLNIGTLVNFNDGGTSNAMWDYASEGNLGGIDYGPSFYIRSSGTFTVTINNSPIVSGQQKYALAFKTNDFAMSYIGRTVQTDTTVTLPTVNQMGIGKPLFPQYPFSGHIARLRYFNTRLLNSQLVELST